MMNAIRLAMCAMALTQVACTPTAPPRPPGTGGSAGAGTGGSAGMGAGGTGGSDLDGGRDGGPGDAGSADSGFVDASSGNGDAGQDGGTGPFFAVVRVGSGLAALSNGATEVFVEIRSVVDGALDRTVAMPTVGSAGGNLAFAMSGTAISEGLLATSVNGRFLLMAGYASTPSDAGSIVASDAGRVVGRIDVATGAVNTTTFFNDGYLASNFRSVASNDGTSYWLAGTGAFDGGAGVRYVVQGATGTSTNISSVQSNLRAVGLFGNELWASTGTALGNAALDAGLTTRLFKFNGLPPVVAAPPVSPPGLPNAGTLTNFVFFDLDATVDGVDTLYLANSDSTGGVQKVHKVNGFAGPSWVTTAALRTRAADAGPAAGCQAVAATRVGLDIVVVCSSTDVPARLVTWTDVGAAAMGDVLGRELVGAPANTTYRGVAFIR